MTDGGLNAPLWAARRRAEVALREELKPFADLLGKAVGIGGGAEGLA